MQVTDDGQASNGASRNLSFHAAASGLHETTHRKTNPDDRLLSRSKQIFIVLCGLHVRVTQATPA